MKKQHNIMTVSSVRLRSCMKTGPDGSEISPVLKCKLSQNAPYTDFEGVSTAADIKADLGLVERPGHFICFVRQRRK